MIGVQGTAHSGHSTEIWWYHPRVSNDFRFHAMMAMQSPTSPEKYRRETAWEYSQSAPFVFKGDLYYYFAEHDVTKTAENIDTSRCAVYLMAGEYDPDANPDEGRRLAGMIKGSKFVAMEGPRTFWHVRKLSSFQDVFDAFFERNSKHGLRLPRTHTQPR